MKGLILSNNRTYDIQDLKKSIRLYCDTWKVLANGVFAQCSNQDREITNSKNQLLPLSCTDYA